METLNKMKYNFLFYVIINMDYNDVALVVRGSDTGSRDDDDNGMVRWGLDSRKTHEIYLHIANNLSNDREKTTEINSTKKKNSSSQKSLNFSIVVAFILLSFLMVKPEVKSNFFSRLIDMLTEEKKIKH